MNETIILEMIKPYIKDGTITYKQFDSIFDMLSRKEQYVVLEILIRNGIDLVDEELFVLDTSEELEYQSENNEKNQLYDDELFKDRNYVDEIENRIVVNKNIKQSNEVLCTLIQDGSKQAEQDLCINNKRLVDKYAVGYKKIYGDRLDFDDLEQAGFIGMIKAAHKFDIKMGTSFSTYAVWWIKQAISREIMDTGNVIRIPVHMLERINKVTKAEKQYSEKTIEVRIKRIAKDLSMKENDVRECLILRNNYIRCSSLNKLVNSDGNTELGELIPEEGQPSVEDIVMNGALRDSLEKALCTLTPREQNVLRLRFGLDDGRPRTLEEIGEEYGVTRERIRQIEAKALRKMNHPSRSKRLRDYL